MESCAIHVVHGRAKVHGCVKMASVKSSRTGGESSRQLGSGSKRLGGVEGLAEAGYVSHRLVTLLGVQEGLTSNLGMSHTRRVCNRV